MKTTFIDQLFIRLTSILIRHNILGLLSILIIILSIIFVSAYIIEKSRFDEGQKRWHNDYNSYLINKFESLSEPKYLIDNNLIYFAVYSTVNMSIEIRSIRDKINPPVSQGLYSEWFSKQTVGPSYETIKGQRYVTYSRKKDTFLYKICFQLTPFIWPIYLWIIVYMMFAFVLLYFYLWIIKSYYIKPIQNIAIEAFQNATQQNPKELSIDKYPYIQYIIESINRLLQAVRLKEQEILKYARSRFVVDSAKRITHNISNLLNPIDYHFEQLPKETRSNEHLRQIEVQFRKIQDQIQQLKKLNSNIINKEVYFVGSIIELILKQLDYLEIEIEYINNSKSNGKCDIDPELIHDALYNLVKNAAEATKENGFKKMKIELLNDVTFISIIISNPVLKEFELNLNEIFEPFLSSKAEGLGIGASVSKRILELHDGDLNYQQKESLIITKIRIPKNE